MVIVLLAYALGFVCLFTGESDWMLRGAGVTACMHIWGIITAFGACRWMKHNEDSSNEGLALAAKILAVVGLFGCAGLFWMGIMFGLAMPA